MCHSAASKSWCVTVLSGDGGQQEVNTGRAELIVIMDSAPFILEQLQQEVDTLTSREGGGGWGGSQMYARIHSHMQRERKS